MLRVLHAQGTRGMRSYPADTQDNALAIVRRIIAELKAMDGRTEHTRIDPADPAKGWKISAGNFKGDCILIVHTAQSAGPSDYNLTALVLEKDREASKAKAERERHWNSIMRITDQNLALKRSQVQPKVPCSACKHGYTDVVIRHVQAHFPGMTVPSLIEFRVPVVCRACNGTGQRDGKGLARVTGLAPAQFDNGAWAAWTARMGEK